MKNYVLVKAERISRSVEENIADLIVKLCDGEPTEVRGMVWDMLATRIAFRSGHGDCFQLPALEDV